MKEYLKIMLLLLVKTVISREQKKSGTVKAEKAPSVAIVLIEDGVYRSSAVFGDLIKLPTAYKLAGNGFN